MFTNFDIARSRTLGGGPVENYDFWITLLARESILQSLEEKKMKKKGFDIKERKREERERERESQGRYIYTVHRFFRTIMLR
jgi:transposase